MHISVLIPIYNEGNNINFTINKINSFFSNKYNYEIIIVDDFSNNNTIEILKSIKNKNIKIFFNKSNKGKGYSLRKAIKESSGDIILTTDADLSADISEFDKLFRQYKKGYSFVIGSRSKKNSIIKVKQNLLRIFLGKSFNILVRIILGLNFKDTQCGFKLYESKKIKPFISLCKIDRFCTDVEILYLAKKNNISVFEEGIIWSNSKKSSVNILLDPINMFFDLINIKFTKY